MKPGAVAAKVDVSTTGSAAWTRGRTAMSRLSVGSAGVAYRTVARISASPSVAPARYSWMDAAARRPAATASMMVLGPETTSPPAKIPARPVARVRGSATMPAQPLTSIPAPSGRIDGSGSSPIATRIAAAGSSRVAPVGAQDDRPPVPASPVGRMTSTRIATTVPSRPTTSVGARPSAIAMPSRSAASISSSCAGMSARPRR